MLHDEEPVVEKFALRLLSKGHVARTWMRVEAGAKRQAGMISVSIGRDTQTQSMVDDEQCTVKDKSRLAWD